MRRPRERGRGLALLALAGIVLPPGARLHLEPDVASPSLTVVDEEIEVESIEVRDGWTLVRYLEYRGWVRPGPPKSLGELRAERVPAAGGPPRDVLEAGRGLLRGGGRELTLERWRLLTDVEDAALLEWLSRATLSAPGRFAAWWRLFPRPRSGPAVFLFADSTTRRSLDPLACGRLRSGVVTASVVPGDPWATLRGLLHQAGHLYAIDLVGTAIPPWLEEGFADSFAAIGERGAGLQKPMPRDAPGVRADEPSPPPIASILCAGRELFADDARGAALRDGARRLARYFWNGGSLTRFERFLEFIGDPAGGKLLGTETFQRRVRLTLPELERRVRSFREPPPNSDRRMFGN